MPNFIIKALRESNYEVLRLRDVLPVDSPDSSVVATSQQLPAILLSLNGDFAGIVTYSPKTIKESLPSKCEITPKFFTN